MIATVYAIFYHDFLANARRTTAYINFVVFSHKYSAYVVFDHV